MGAAVTVSALPSSKVNVTVVSGLVTAGVTAALKLGVVGPGVVVGVGVGVEVGAGVEPEVGVGVGVGVAVGSGDVVGSGVGVVGDVLVEGSGVVAGAGVVAGSGAVEVVGSGVELDTGVGVLVPSAWAGPTSESVAATARTAVAEAIAIRRRRRVFGDEPGVKFTMFLSLHVPRGGRAAVGFLRTRAGA